MLKLEDVVSFLKVAEVGGFSRAAYALCISKSVISTRVSRLEREVGTKLLARTTRGVSLTDAGRKFQHRCTATIVDIELACDSLRSDRDDLGGTMR